MKRIIAMFVACAAVLSFAGCGGSSEKAGDAKKGAEKAVNAYCDAFANAEFDEAIKFVSEDSQLYKNLSEDKDFLSEERLTTLPGEVPAGAEKTAAEFAKDMKEKLMEVFNAIDVEVESVKEDKDTATVVVKTNYDLGKIKYTDDKELNANFVDKCVEKISALTEKELTELEKKDGRGEYELACEAYQEIGIEWIKEKTKGMKENKKTVTFELEKIDEVWKISSVK